MTIYLRLAASLLIFVPNLLLAFSCFNPELERTDVKGNLHSFKGVVKCLITEDIDIAALKDDYRDEIMTSSQFTIIQPARPVEVDGLKGYFMEATQKYDSGHGMVSVTSEIFLLDNALDKFLLEIKSKKISANGDAKYTKFSHDYVIVSLGEEKSILTNIKEIKVEKPWIAPESIFLQKVQENISTEMKYTAPRHAQKTFGVAIEALRKRKMTRLAKRPMHYIFSANL